MEIMVFLYAHERGKEMCHYRRIVEILQFMVYSRKQADSSKL